MTMSLRLRSKIDLLKSGLAQLRKVWDESKHPRDPRGRFGSGSGAGSDSFHASPPFGEVYWHGTADSLIEHIRAKGLVPHHERSSTGMELYGHVPGYKNSVFMTNDYNKAKEYAEGTAALRSLRSMSTDQDLAEPVVLRIRLTAAQRQNLIVDEADVTDRSAMQLREAALRGDKTAEKAVSQMAEVFAASRDRGTMLAIVREWASNRPGGIGASTQFRLVGRIPPSQIDVMSGNNEWQPLAKVATFEHTFYVVIPVVPGAIGK